MASVEEVSNLAANFLVNPLAAGTSDVCEICSTFTDGWRRCYPCQHQPAILDTVAAISYSEDAGPLHQSLRGYKDRNPRARRAHQIRLAAILWRFVTLHERCQAEAADVGDRFDVVTTVPARSAQRDEHHPLRTIVSEWVTPLAPRYRRLLRPNAGTYPQHEFHPDRFAATLKLSGESVLLVEDTWTRGGSTRSAAHSLKDAGAGSVGVVVLGRHINPAYSDNAKRLADIATRSFDWNRCTHC